MSPQTIRGRGCCVFVKSEPSRQTDLFDDIEAYMKVRRQKQLMKALATAFGVLTGSADTDRQQVDRFEYRPALPLVVDSGFSAILLGVSGRVGSRSHVVDRPEGSGRSVEAEASSGGVPSVAFGAGFHAVGRESSAASACADLQRARQ